MNKIQNLNDFKRLDYEKKNKIWNNDINRISIYIKQSKWYRSQALHIQNEINIHPPWMLYKNTENNTPVRLFGYIDQGGINIKNNTSLSYNVATMEDDEKNSLSIGIIHDINRITPITWNDIDNFYIKELEIAKCYGGDIIFLKPEMFLTLTKIYQ